MLQISVNKRPFTKLRSLFRLSVYRYFAALGYSSSLDFIGKKSKITQYVGTFVREALRKIWIHIDESFINELLSANYVAETSTLKQLWDTITSNYGPGSTSVKEAYIAQGSDSLKTADIIAYLDSVYELLKQAKVYVVFATDAEQILETVSLKQRIEVHQGLKWECNEQFLVPNHSFHFYFTLIALSLLFQYCSS